MPRARPVESREFSAHAFHFETSFHCGTPDLDVSRAGALIHGEPARFVLEPPPVSTSTSSQ